MNVRIFVCHDCDRSTSGDCGMHGPLFIPTGVVTAGGVVPCKCPACSGTGIVFGTSISTYPCRACRGSGIVWRTP